MVGCSGGGPYALACATVLAERVRSAAVVSGVGPAWELPEVTAALTPLRREQVDRARTDLDEAWTRLLDETTAEVEGLAGDPDPVPDIEEAGLRRRVEAALRETAALGPDGPASDLYLNYLRPWGFRLEDVAVPVFVWHAENDDVVPVGVGRAVAARLPDARLRFTPAGGHFLTWTRAEDILRELAREL